MKNENQNIQGKEFKTKYVVVSVYVPTEKNHGFESKQELWFVGKRGMTSKVLDKYFKDNYAYDRKCDAEKMLKSYKEIHENEQSFGYWFITDTIMEIKERE